MAFRFVFVTATQKVSSGPDLVMPATYRGERLATAEIAQLLCSIG